MPVSLPGVFLGLFVLTEYPLEELTHIIPIFLAAAQMQQVLFADLSLSKDQKTIGFIPKPTEKQKKTGRKARFLSYNLTFNDDAAGCH